MLQVAGLINLTEVQRSLNEVTFGFLNPEVRTQVTLLLMLERDEIFLTLHLIFTPVPYASS